MAALRIVFLVLAIGILGLLGWRAGPIRAAPSRLAPLERAMRMPPAPVLASLSAPAPVLPPAASAGGEVPEFLGFYGRLRGDFPHDYSALRDREKATPPDAAVWDALRDLEQSKGVLAAAAGAETLDRFFDARSAVLAGLAPLDARRCVDFLYGVADAGLADFTAAHRALVATLADRTLDAIADGRDHPVERSAPTEADLDALSASLAAFGLAPAEIGLLIDGATPDPPLPDRRVCEIGRTYFDVLHGLPADARGRIYGLAAQLLARS